MSQQSTRKTITKPPKASLILATANMPNAQQKKAIETIEGPVMVVAGPGTGKTEVVAKRTAYILQKTHMRPTNILCLTYSVSGATAMRERLRTIIGADAYGVTVTTIHGFCNEIIQSFPEVFHEFGELEQVSDVQRYHILNKIIDQLSARSVIINPKDRYGRTGAILQRISEVKREGITTEALRNIIPLYQEEMQQKSREGTKVHERNLRLAKQYEEFVTLFSKYQEALSEQNLYDYEDMILFVVRALEEEEWLLGSLQERYQYVLVDEFQDTNGAQNKVIELLTTAPEGVGEPNLFVVGDDDQAIYRFQGANVTNMIAFKERFPDAPVITLTQSYRATQELLDAAGQLIEHNEERLVGKVEGLTKNLTSALQKKHGKMPELIRPVSGMVEGFAITEKIQSFVKDGTPLSEIAVLLRTNAELFAMHKILEGMDVPVQIRGKMNVLENTKVQECIALLRAIHSSDDSVWAGALGCSCFSIHPADLGMLFAVQREENTLRREENKTRKHIGEILLEIEKRGEEWGLREAVHLLHARNVLLHLVHKVHTVTLPQFVEEVLVDTGLIPNSGNDIHPLDLTALQEFFDFVKRRSYESPSFNLKELLHDIKYREEYGIHLQYDVPHLIDDGVQLMTAHSAKGLEFDVVILPNFREKHWDHKRAPPKLSLPEHLIFDRKDEKELQLQDERRLAYVAWTRAKRQLLMSCPERMTRGEREQNISPSQFFVEGGTLRESVYEIRHPEKANTLLLSPMDIELDEQLQTFLKKRLEKFELSVSSLNKFLLDPYLFLHEDLLRVPQARNVTTAYGIAVHKALHEWGRNIAKDFGFDELLSAFKTAISEKEVLTKIELDSFLHLGETALKKYYGERLAGKLPEIYGLEKTLTARFEDIPLKGKLDRIDLYAPQGAKVHIIDYKTGAPKTEKQVREDRKGSLFRQMAFYKLLCDESPAFAGYEAVELSLDFIGERDKDPHILTFTITAEELNELKETIRKVWQKIMKLDFSPLET